ncbi:DUF6920 family protein [Pedobacter boryungensis]|uniref:DUF3883 domain-containing protein n=1 Tax=Pedobacter boryungensis TaxID=869962 RepID=A0ABX2DE95_9SPHI|nr:DUF6544 family protein [Pedobacter boryungensis]NQX31611.1 hypothetical protein [Pedobacter boryungensis]
MEIGELKTFFSLELRRARALVKRIYTGKRKLEELPMTLQHFLIHSGFMTDVNIHQTKIEWKSAALKFNKTANWKSINCIQHNFLPDPIRLVYMKSKMFGIFSLEAFDSFRHGRGAMMVRMAKIFNITNAKGPEMDKAELVTILAETMIIPDYALQTYIQWEEISHYEIKGTISYYGIKASGIFYFNNNFEIEKFETEDRCYTDKNGKFHSIKWTAECSDYTRHRELSFPTNFKATWNFPTGDFTYFKGEIDNIIINP